jgi:hypothetical protein
VNDRDYRKLNDRFPQDYNQPEYAVKADYRKRYNLTEKDVNQLHRIFSPHRIVQGLYEKEVKDLITIQNLIDKGFSDEDIKRIYSEQFKEEDRETAIDLLDV